MFLALPSYPGRGLVALRSADGALSWLYFLTGRSNASRERRFSFRGDRLLVEPTAPGPPDELRHYACVRGIDGGVVVGNGSHVDVLAELAVDEVVARLEPEPDPPIYTPRIAAVVRSDSSTVQTIAVRRGSKFTDRSVDAVALGRGEGLILHTYGGSTDDVRTDSRPRPLTTDLGPAILATTLWDSLASDVRIALSYGRADSAEPLEIISA